MPLSLEEKKRYYDGNKVKSFQASCKLQSKEPNRMTNKVGIIYSPGFGAGWSTWGCYDMAVDQELALAIENKEPYEKLEEIALRKWPDVYLGGLEECVVMWVDKGTQFKIEEYDGNESIEFNHDFYWSIA